MSTLYADPGFGRGQTLGITVKLYEAENGDGTTVIGARKAFRDESPITGVINSNRTVECIAVKNSSGAALLPGEIAMFQSAASADIPTVGGILGEIKAKANTTTPTGANAALFGVVDEYLPSGGAANGEVFWLVVRGPSTVRKTSTAVSAGAAYGPSATDGQAAAQGANALLGYAISDAGTGTTTGRVLVRTTAGF
jgi:hypothetical protein